MSTGIAPFDRRTDPGPLEQTWSTPRTPRPGRRTRRAERRRLKRQDVLSSRLAELQVIRGVLEQAAGVVERGWVQGAWFAVAAPGGAHAVTAYDLGVAVGKPVTGACLVGAVVQAAGGPSEARSQLVQRTLDVTWHALREDPGEPVRWCPRSLRPDDARARADLLERLTGTDPTRGGRPAPGGAADRGRAGGPVQVRAGGARGARRLRSLRARTLPVSAGEASGPPGRPRHRPGCSSPTSPRGARRWGAPGQPSTTSPSVSTAGCGHGGKAHAAEADNIFRPYTVFGIETSVLDPARRLALGHEQPGPIGPWAGDGARV